MHLPQPRLMSAGGWSQPLELGIPKSAMRMEQTFAGQQKRRRGLPGPLSFGCVTFATSLPWLPIAQPPHHTRQKDDACKQNHRQPEEAVALDYGKPPISLVEADIQSESTDAALFSCHRVQHKRKACVSVQPDRATKNKESTAATDNAQLSDVPHANCGVQRTFSCTSTVGASWQFFSTANFPSTLATSEIGKDVSPPSMEIRTSISWSSNVRSSSMSCATVLPRLVHSGFSI